MEQVELQRYQITGLLGTGADYDVRAAIDQETRQQVVLKRPVPQAISRQMHGPIEARTDRTLQLYQDLGNQIPHLAPVLGYSARANHDRYYGDSLGQEYRVLVVARAQGIPLAGDVRARILKVPIGLGQNLFALHPLPYLASDPPFGVQQQLVDLQERFFDAGYVLLDQGPQNIFYQPATNSITIIDSGDLVAPLEPSSSRSSSSRSRRHRDIHDFYLEVLKFYIVPQLPPRAAAGYRDPYGMRPVISLEEELDELARRFGNFADPARNAALYLIAKVRDRAYTDFGDFRKDLTGYLEEVRIRNRTLTNLDEAKQAWRDALQLLHEEYWRRYLFNPITDLAAFDTFV
ncbi:MAG TPA: hypothetical protein VFR55_10955 [Dehalococcoidia bacterium]|nr:hypothetical protein [Dehalococcoidia bacterium]